MCIKPMVSVIIPIYNSEKYLHQCLESIINQTLKDIEIICINDGSQDNSLSILESFSYKDKRIKVIDQKNSGAAEARNRGLKEAEGEYVSILDSDDFFEPTMLEKACYIAKKTDADIVIYKVRFYDNITKKFYPCNWSIRENIRPQKEVFTPADVDNYIFQLCNGWAWDKLFKKSFIDNKNLTFQNTRVFNDAFFVFMSLVKASKITILDEILATKRRSVNNSISSTRERYWREFYPVINAMKKELISSNLYKNVEQSFINYALHLPLHVLNSIGGRGYFKLYNYLRKEYFKEMEFNKYDEDYYYNLDEYARFLEIQKNPLWFDSYQRFIRCLLSNGIRYTIKKIREKFIRI